jgi:DNA-binding NarL/FixJ family response regulator
VKRVFLLEDHNAFRQCLAALVDHEPDLEVVAEAGSLHEARNSASEGLGEADVVVIDLLLPDGTGTNLIEDLRAANSGASVMVLTVLSQREVRNWASAMGVDEVMYKYAPLEEIVDTIRRLGD